MNFELAKKLCVLVEANKLDDAIALAETELSAIPQTAFHEILGNNLLHQSSDLAVHAANFDLETAKVLNQKQGVLTKLFGPKTQSRPAAYYCEMNGFTINGDRWYLDLFSFEKFGTGDWDWLCNFYDRSAQNFTIMGFEDIQAAFQDVHQNDRFDEPNIDNAYEVCELLVILRLQELFRETYKYAQGEWATIPMFVTAHDYDLIYRVV